MNIKVYVGFMIEKNVIDTRFDLNYNSLTVLLSPLITLIIPDLSITRIGITTTSIQSKIIGVLYFVVILALEYKKHLYDISKHDIS